MYSTWYATWYATCQRLRRFKTMHTCVRRGICILRCSYVAYGCLIPTPFRGITATYILNVYTTWYVTCHTMGHVSSGFAKRSGAYDEQSHNQNLKTTLSSSPSYLSVSASNMVKWDKYIDVLSHFKPFSALRVAFNRHAYRQLNNTHLQIITCTKPTSTCPNADQSPSNCEGIF